MKKFTSKTQKTGELGETIACKYLISHGFKILERNFTRKWGEIDIVAQKNEEKGRVTHFIEVKSVSHETGQFRPEDQMHHWKQKRLMRVIQTYLELHETDDWQFDVICVYLDFNKRQARVKVLGDVILG